MSVQSISVVIPVFRGEATLEKLVDEVLNLAVSSDECSFQICEILLVNDCSRDKSAEVMRSLASKHQIVRNIWLSRNFGQHSATIAGISHTVGDWVLTLDEDGQHNPNDIPALLYNALQNKSQLVYGCPNNSTSDGFVRRCSSQFSKSFSQKILKVPNATLFQSFRLIIGSIARGTSAYASSGIYLDVALQWVVNNVSIEKVNYRNNSLRRSGYSMQSLMSHYFKLLVTSGTKALQLVTFLGIVFGSIGIATVGFLLWGRFHSNQLPVGWTSLMAVELLGIGSILICMGVLAGYIGAILKVVIGKPLYLETDDPLFGPLFR